MVAVAVAATLFRLWLARGWGESSMDPSRPGHPPRTPPHHPLGCDGKGVNDSSITGWGRYARFIYYYTFPIHVEVGQDARISQSSSHLRCIFNNLNKYYCNVRSLFRTLHLSRSTAAAHCIQYDINNRVFQAETIR